MGSVGFGSLTFAYKLLNIVFGLISVIGYFL